MPLLLSEDDDRAGVPYADFTGWRSVRGTVALGVGLLFTTLAGAFALVADPPWLA